MEKGKRFYERKLIKKLCSIITPKRKITTCDVCEWAIQVNGNKYYCPRAGSCENAHEGYIAYIGK